MKILLLEDGKREIQAFKDACEYFESPDNTKIHTDYSETIDEFKNLFFSEKKYDAIVIDLKLDSKTNKYDGNRALELALNYTKSILFIYSSTVQHTENELLEKYKESPLIKVIDRGPVTVTELIALIYDIYKTGITEYLKSENSLNNLINDLFWNNTGELIDYLQNENGSNNQNVIQNYLGIALESRIIETFGEDNEKIPGILLYISPNIKEKITTGSIIKHNNELFFVITPACDLAQHKTNYLNLIKIITEEQYLKYLDDKNEVARSKGYRGSKIFDNSVLTKSGIGVKGELERNPKGVSPFFGLPKGIFLKENMILDFHQITTISHSDPRELICHVHSRITKDIISQFSSLFNRQGSPEYEYQFDYMK